MCVPLLEQVVNSMTDLYAFMGEANTILDTKVHGETPAEVSDDPYALTEQVWDVEETTVRLR